MMTPRRALAFCATLAFWLVACAPDASAPTPDHDAPNAAPHDPTQQLLSSDELDDLTCGQTLEGEVSTVSPEAAALGITRYTYSVNSAEQTLQIQAWDAAGALVARLESAIWLEDALTGRASIDLYTADGTLQLQERGRARLELGFGQRFEVTRTVGDQTVTLRAQTTAEKAANRFAVSTSVPAGTPGARPGANGPEASIDLIDADGAFALSRDDLDAWSDAQGVAEALGGQWDRLKATLLEDEGLRQRAYTHTLWCGMDDAGRRSTREATLGALASKASGPLPDGFNRREQDLTCAQEENIRGTVRDTTAALDFVSTHAGKLALGGPVEYLVNNTNDFGLAVTIDAGDYGSYTLTRADLNTLRDLGKALVLGPAVVLGAGTFGALGIALAGFSAGTYIAARVVETFGEDALTDYLSNREREARDRQDRINAKHYADIDPFKSKATTTGDPHFTSHDGLAWSFQNAGEFWVVRSLDGAFAVQTRQTPLSLGGGRCPGGVSGNSAAAILVDGHRVEVYADSTDLRIDGMTVPPAGPGFLLAGGGEVALEGADLIVVRTSAGDVVRIKRSSFMLHVSLGPALQRSGALEGLFGDFDGDPTNDLALPGGAALEAPSRELIAGAFADAWRVQSDDARLFTDGALGDFDVPGYPTLLIQPGDIPAADRAEAEGRCQARGVADPLILAQCAVDLYCTGLDDLADEHARRKEPLMAADIQDEAPLPIAATPINYSGWTHFGPADRDRWEVSTDGDLVDFTQDSDPAAFISPRAYTRVTLEGYLYVTSDGDDDVIGFVTGLNPADPDTLDAIVISWKGADQAPAREGLTIARARVPLTDWSDDQLWAQLSSPDYTILASSYGAGLGWRPDTSAPFTLTQTPTRLTLRLTGVGTWVVDAPPEAPFSPGRVGFYDYSQGAASWRYVTERRDTSLDNLFSACELTPGQNEGAVDSEHLLTCPPGCEPNAVWGTDLYTDDSSICTAAVHAGLIDAATGGAVRYIKRDGAASYTGSARNGVTSNDYGAWDGSFELVP